MYAEELKHKQIGTVAGIFLTLGIVFGMLFCIFVVSFLQYWLGVYWIQIILYGLVILLVFVIVKKWLTEYIYLIEKDRITFGRRIGKREKELLFIPLRDILEFGPYAEMESKIAGKKRFNFTFKKKTEAFVILCTGCVILMSPTEAYIDSLRAVKNRKKKPEESDAGTDS